MHGGGGEIGIAVGDVLDDVNKTVVISIFHQAPVAIEVPAAQCMVPVIRNLGNDEGIAGTMGNGVMDLRIDCKKCIIVSATLGLFEFYNEG